MRREWIHRPPHECFVIHAFTAGASPWRQGNRIWVVIRPSEPDLKRARAGRDPVIGHPKKMLRIFWGPVDDWRECTNGGDYWIPALSRRAEARFARPE